MPAPAETPRVLSNDDGWILSTYGPPIGIDDLRDKVKRAYLYRVVVPSERDQSICIYKLLKNWARRLN